MMAQAGETREMLTPLSREELEKHTQILGLTLAQLLYSCEDFIQVMEGYNIDPELAIHFPTYVALKEQVSLVNSVLDGVKSDE